MIDLEGMSKDELIRTLRSFVSDALDNYREAGETSKQDEFQAGRQLAYYEMLDILKSRIQINNGKMSEIELPV